MKKSSKITIIVFICLIIAAVPLYYVTRPAPMQAGIALQITGKVANPLNFTAAQLQAMQSTTIQVTLKSSSRTADNGVFNYTGISLSSLLRQANIQDSATSIYVQAPDRYGETLTIQEANNPNTIIAYQKDGAPLTLLKNDGEGPLR
jgi:DMSO/TMAO reductase YedYZ molybdopterin-dependent catalytic subunit